MSLCVLLHGLNYLIVYDCQDYDRDHTCRYGEQVMVIEQLSQIKTSNFKVSKYMGENRNIKPFTFGRSTSNAELSII